MRLAMWQCEQHPEDVTGNLARLAVAARRAAADDAQVLVLPEMFLTGYAIGAEATRRLAEPAGGPSSATVAGLARETGVTIAYGYPERDGTDVFNAVQWISPDGARGGYRKTHLFGADDRDAFAPSSVPGTVVVIGGWPVGFLICYDVEFPEAVRSLAMAGAELVLVPTANMVGYDAVPQILVPARAYENQVFVAYANCCGTEKDLTYGGLSTVVAPDGAVLAAAGRQQEWLVADLDADHPGRTLNTYLADRRPEVYGDLSS